MYPRTWFDTYWRGNLRNEVFVVMSFSAEFDPVWQNSIRPAIEEDLAGGGKFTAHRVDSTALSGSIVAEIYDGVAHASLVFADVSITSTGKWIGQRNGNAMYEVGLAMALRPETDLNLVKSDSSDLNFDLLQIRVHQYQQDQQAESRKKFGLLLQCALDARKSAAQLLAKHTWSRLDRDCLFLMSHHKDFKPFHMAQDATHDQRHAVIRLLELGIIRCECPAHGTYRYVWTDFGKAVYSNPNMIGE